MSQSGYGFSHRCDHAEQSAWFTRATPAAILRASAQPLLVEFVSLTRIKLGRGRAIARGQSLLVEIRQAFPQQLDGSVLFTARLTGPDASVLEIDDCRCCDHPSHRGLIYVELPIRRLHLVAAVAEAG